MKSLDDILKIAQNVQEQMGQAQANLDSIEVEGIAGGGLVKVRATAKGRILGVAIDESLLNPAEKQIVEDLVAAAINDAVRRVEATTQEKMSGLTGGLPMPPGFKLPF